MKGENERHSEREYYRDGLEGRELGFLRETFASEGERRAFERGEDERHRAETNARILADAMERARSAGTESASDGSDDSGSGGQGRSVATSSGGSGFATVVIICIAGALLLFVSREFPGLTKDDSPRTPGTPSGKKSEPSVADRTRRTLRTEPPSYVVFPSDRTRDVRLFRRVDPSEPLAITDQNELKAGEDVVSVQLELFDRGKPEKVLLTSRSPSGRYAFIEACSPYWCDDFRVVDVSQGIIVSLQMSKWCNTINVSWAPDEAYVVAKWNHAGVSGLTAVDLTRFAVFQPGIALDSLFPQTRAQPGVRYQPGSPPSDPPYIEVDAKSIRWITPRRIWFEGDLVGTTFTKGLEEGSWIGTPKNVGRVQMTMAIPTLDPKPAGRADE